MSIVMHISVQTLAIFGHNVSTLIMLRMKIEILTDITGNCLSCCQETDTGTLSYSVI